MRGGTTDRPLPFTLEKILFPNQPSSVSNTHFPLVENEARASGSEVAHALAKQQSAPILSDPASQLRQAQRQRVALARYAAPQDELDETRKIAQRGSRPVRDEQLAINHIFTQHGTIRNFDALKAKFAQFSDHGLHNLAQWAVPLSDEGGCKIKKLASDELEKREFARMDLEEDFSPDAFKGETPDLSLAALRQPLLDGLPIDTFKDYIKKLKSEGRED